MIGIFGRRPGKHTAEHRIARLKQQLTAAENNTRTYKAACDGLADERDKALREAGDWRERCAWLEQQLEEARAEAAEVQQRATVLRRDLQASRAAQERANAEVEQLRAARHDLIDRQHTLEVDNRQLFREVRGAAETQALDVSELRAKPDKPSAPVAVAVPIDDDTLTLPVPAAPPSPVVRDTASDDTRPVVTIDPAMRKATPVKPVPPQPGSGTAAVRTLAQAHAGGAA